jgi:hypothetical protein
LKHLATFVPVMREDLDSVFGKPGCLSYFPLDIQNELVNLPEKRGRQAIISSI